MTVVWPSYGSTAPEFHIKPILDDFRDDSTKSLSYLRFFFPAIRALLLKVPSNRENPTGNHRGFTV